MKTISLDAPACHRRGAGVRACMRTTRRQIVLKKRAAEARDARQAARSRT